MSNQVITTPTIEIYDENNVRTGYLKKDKIFTYFNARQEVVHVDAATGVSPGPYTPTSKAINLISDVIELITIYSYAAVKVIINGSADQIAVNGFFTISGTAITSIEIVNELPAEVKVDIIQGDEVMLSS